MPGCAAIGCNNRSEKGYTMKCFPRDPALRSIWKQRVGRADWEPSNNSFLCHVHFDPNQWVVTQNGKVKLKKGAVPSIFTVTSTRKSPKKRQKIGAQSTDDTDADEYEVEYLDNDGPLILSLANQNRIPSIINVPLQNTTTVGGKILQNIKILSSGTLKNLQNENVIIVADENNREIGKLVNDNTFIMLEDIRGKENVQLPAKPDKPSSTEVKIEVKEEELENGLSTHDYDEIERKLQELHSENETDSCSNSKDSFKKINSMSTEMENSFALEDLENVSDNAKENSSQGKDSDARTEKTGTRQKRKWQHGSSNEDNATKTSRSLIKTVEARLNEDARNIINDLEAETSQDCDNVPVVSVKNSQTNGMHKSAMQRVSSIPSKLKNNVKMPVQSKSNHIKNVNILKTPKELAAKLKVQAEVIEKLTSQLIMYKDMDRKVKTLTQELQNKNKDIEVLMGKVALKKFVEMKTKNDSPDLTGASEAYLKNRVEFLEDNVKKLMKTISIETQNRRKFECQVRSRDNQIKELNWKLDKAAKFLDRAEKNTNNYKKKMTHLQAELKRKEKSSAYDEFLNCQSNGQSIPNKSLEMALEIEKACGIEGYQKLLDYKFPLPSLKLLSKTYPTEVEYYEAEEEVSFESWDTETGALDISDVDIKMENVEYLDPEFLKESSETKVQTVQDIFNECDSDDLNINELRKHIHEVFVNT